MRKLLFSITLLAIIFFSLKTVAGEKSAYEFSWLDPDKEVYVLQNRKYTKRGKLHLNLGAGKTVSGAFVDAYAFQGRIGYFPWEEWGMEVIYSLNKGEENNNAKAVRNPGGAGSIPFRRIVDNYLGVMLLWSPFYGKVNTFNAIVYFDWILSLGYAKLEETNNRDSIIVGVDRPETTLSHGSLMWGTALKFYAGKHMNIRLDLTTCHYRARTAKDISTTNSETWYSNYDLTLSLGFDF